MPRQRVAVGTRRYDGRQRRWLRWSGRHWSPAVYSRAPGDLQEPTPLDQRPALALERRQALLDQAVDAEVLGGATLVRQSPLTAVLDYRRPVSRVAHLLATVVTGGLWGVVWIVMAVSRQSDRLRLAVDDQGHVWADDGATTV